MGHKSRLRSWNDKGAFESEITFPAQAGKSRIFVLKTEILMFNFFSFGMAENRPLIMQLSKFPSYK